MKRLVFTVFAAQFAWASATLAADVGIGNPAFTTPNALQAAPGVPAPNVVNNDDRLFVRELTIGGRAEVELGELALSKSPTPLVTGFARRMITDHQEANRRLADLARAKDLPQPQGLDQEHRDIMMQLEMLAGHGFDLAYIKSQIIDHQKTVHLLEWEISNGENDDIRSFAGDMLPLIMDHLQMAKAVEDELTGRPSDTLVSETMRH